MHSIKYNVNGSDDMQMSQNKVIVKTIKDFVEIENEFIQILIKMHLVMCLALNKRRFTKERKKEEESTKMRRSGAALKKNIMKSVNS